jgi:hypothetical protein
MLLCLSSVFGQICDLDLVLAGGIVPKAKGDRHVNRNVETIDQRPVRTDADTTFTNPLPSESMA